MSTALEPDYFAFQQLLVFLATFGNRYRIWQGETAISPTELLSQLGSAAVLQYPCSLQAATIQREGKTIYGIQVMDAVYESGKMIPQAPSPYVLEDLLTLATVAQWVEQQEPEQVIAELHRDAQLSTFLEHYYQDVLGFVPEHLSTTRLPLWCAYLEGLLHGLNPNGRLERVEVPAEVIVTWLGEIGFIFISAQADSDCGVDLDDGEEADQGLWAAVETGQPSC